MKSIYKITILSLLLFTGGCIVQFIPDPTETSELLVVDGLITDEPAANHIRISRSLPIGSLIQSNKPVTGCIVSISDDQDNDHLLQEINPGNYITDSLIFRGIVGRKYTLHIQTENQSYESLPMELKPVPGVDSLYFEKVDPGTEHFGSPDQGCQIFVNTHDPENNCRFYRWQYTETWEFRLPYMYPSNKICWISNNSSRIFIKNTSTLKEARITRLPLDMINTETDRLKERYSILVKQYSLNEDEYSYWENLQKITEEVGGLYDIIPVSVPSNIRCIGDPFEEVLGYFSVSAVSSKRIFISGIFNSGSFPDSYKQCPIDTIPSTKPIPDLNKNIWIMEEVYKPFIPYPFYVLTTRRGCADCSVRGTIIKPSYW